MKVLAEVVDAVVGADTHRDNHYLALAAPSGVVIAELEIGNHDVGFAQALRWIERNAPGPNVVAAVEGTRSYGVGLGRALAGAGRLVVEVERPRRQDRRKGKSDAGDARLACLAGLRMPVGQLPTPRRDGVREALRILLAARRDLSIGRTAQVNRLRALLLTGDDADRVVSRSVLNDRVLAGIARRRGPNGDPGVQQVVARREAKRLATAIRQANADLAENKDTLRRLVTDAAPGLLALTGVGPVSSAQALVSWSHPGRCRSEAAFASLAGASPIPASSGQTHRFRLNRGGDRALNRALHDIVLTRWRICPRTQTYVSRRRAEGMSDRDIRRCLKRYVARELFRVMEASSMA